MKLCLLLAFASLHALLASADESPMGRLCFGQECRDARCGATVAPAATNRPFTFAGTSPRTYTFGVLEANRTAIDCAAEGTVTLRVATPRLAPTTPVRVTVSRDRTEWSLPLVARDLASP
ncbi:MAG TPA: hypothetical protein VF911_08495, partial [Thermoanaerobaculia bacterium]